MPANTILKPDPDQDLYVVWIDSVDGPAAWGTRAECEAELADPCYGEHAATPDRFERADRTGSSRRYGSDLVGMVVYSPPRPDGGPGWISREAMVAWLRSGLDPAHLEPLEDEEPVNG